MLILGLGHLDSAVPVPQFPAPGYTPYFFLAGQSATFAKVHPGVRIRIILVPRISTDIFI